MDGYPNNKLSTESVINVLLTRFFCCRFVKHSTGPYVSFYAQFSKIRCNFFRCEYVKNKDIF